MSNNTEATPRPWRVLPYQYVLNKPTRGRIHGPNNEPVVDDANPTLADAALIVRAVNSFDALTEALRLMLADVEAYQSNPYGHSPSTQVANARAALKLAEGKE